MGADIWSSCRGNSMRRRLISRSASPSATGAAACSSMGWTLPDNVATFVQRVDSARQRVVKATELSAEAEGKKDELKESFAKPGTVSSYCRRSPSDGTPAVKLCQRGLSTSDWQSPPP